MSPILELHNISKRFGAIVIADQLDLALEQGEALGIIGPNGAGKTTLFGIMTGTVAPDAGHVRFAGDDVTRLSPEQRCRKGIARSFQIPQPFGKMTVFENLMVAATFGAQAKRSLPRDIDPNTRCLEILDQCGLADGANRQAGTLTLLDRKRLELARALATEPRVLLLDEVAGGLTELESRALVELIKALRRTGLSIIWIEHVVHALVAAVDRLVVLHNGQFIAQGDPQAVIRSPAVMEIYMGIAADA
ncbi:MAG TPA: ABC transporter ATP-binding protein [Xanthobacteraceae bacterium]|nr:ABC transporter ATP-binding protein [Xanthobacteraceae bacterium]